MKKQFDGLLKKAMWIAIILFVIRTALSWEELKAAASIYTVFGYAGEAIGVAVVLMVCYEKCLWRYDPFVKTPYIAGEYTGTLISEYDRTERNGILKIKQTFLSVEVSLKTEESKSRSVSGTIEEILGKPELIYTYLNEPGSGVRERSAIHFGTAMIVIDDKDHMVGRYYTDRGTSGDMIFAKVEK